jgi:VanZ family protein
VKLNKVVFRFAFLSALLFILVFSLLPDISVRLPEFDWFDKIVHAAAYAVLGVLAFFSFVIHHRAGITRGILIVIILSMYGGLIELLQSCTGRSPDVYDLLFDVIGTLAGMGSSILFFAMKGTRKETGKFPRR